MVDQRENRERRRRRRRQVREDVRRRRTAVKPPTLLTPEYACALLGTRGSRVRSLGAQGSDLG